MKKFYELDKILKLVAERELLTTQLKTIELPKVIINSELNIPLYKFCMSPVGDFMIFINRRQRHSLFGSLSKIELPEELLNYREPEIMISYLEASRMLKQLKLKKSSSAPPRLVRARTPEEEFIEEDYFSEDSEEISWRLILALPAYKCIPIIELLYKVFEDDLYQYKEEHPN